MDFKRLILTSKNEFYRFSKNYNDLAYVLLTDNFKKAPNSFGKNLYDDFMSSENWMLFSVLLGKN